MKRLALAILVLALVAPACSPPSADALVRGVMAQRNNYDATPLSWIQREDGSLLIEVMVVNNNAEGALRTLTVLVEQLDAEEKILRSSREVLNVATLTAGMGENMNLTVGNAAALVENIRLLREPNPPEADWDEFPEFAAVRPRI